MGGERDQSWGLVSCSGCFPPLFRRVRRSLFLTRFPRFFLFRCFLKGSEVDERDPLGSGETELRSLCCDRREREGFVEGHAVPSKGGGSGLGDSYAVLFDEVSLQSLYAGC